MSHQKRKILKELHEMPREGRGNGSAFGHALKCIKSEPWFMELIDSLPEETLLGQGRARILSKAALVAATVGVPECSVCRCMSRVSSFHIDTQECGGCYTKRIVSETIRNESAEARYKRLSNTRKTMVERYGVHATGLSKKLMKRVAETNLARYGFASSSQNENVKAKAAQTHASKGSYTNPEELKRRRSKWEETRERKAGPDWRRQDMDRLVAARYKLKLKEMPDGRTLKLQGWEPSVVDWLLSKGVPSKSIRVPGGIPRSNGSYYFPDLEVVTKGWLIEVKSNYTMGLGKTGARMFRSLQRKSRDVEEHGRRLTVVLSDGKTVIAVFKNIHEMTIREARQIHREATQRLQRTTGE